MRRACDLGVAQEAPARVTLAHSQVVAKEIYGVYLDRYVHTEDRWWFASREWHALARTAPDLAVHATPDALDDWLA